MCGAVGVPFAICLGLGPFAAPLVKWGSTKLADFDGSQSQQVMTLSLLQSWFTTRRFGWKIDDLVKNLNAFARSVVVSCNFYISGHGLTLYCGDPTSGELKNTRVSYGGGQSSKNMAKDDFRMRASARVIICSTRYLRFDKFFFRTICADKYLCSVYSMSWWSIRCHASAEPAHLQNHYPSFCVESVDWPKKAASQ